MLPKRLEPFVGPIVAMCRTQFPRTCHTCNRRFDDFGQWVALTDPIGAPTLEEEGEEDVFGMVSWVNCVCGSTLVLECEDMAGPMHRQFMQALAEESALSGRRVRALLEDLRSSVRQQAVEGVV